MGTRTRQAELALKYRGRGGYRPGAGRPRSGRHAVPHRSRPKVAARHPVHVTLRVRDEVWNLRSRRCFRALARGFARGKDRFGFRLVHFSVQGNHLHLIVEVADEAALARGMQGLAIRMAKALNRVMQRRGPVFRERYHAHVLRSPTEVARAVAYVLGNYFHHAAKWGTTIARGQVDPYSSAAEHDKMWTGVDPPLTVEPRTWLLRVGVERGGATRRTG
jgi:REP element-mobilizing transposase RayT